MNTKIKNIIALIIASIFGVGAADAKEKDFVGSETDSGATKGKLLSNDYRKKQNHTKIAQSGTIQSLDEFLQRYSGSAVKATNPRRRKVKARRRATRQATPRSQKQRRSRTRLAQDY